MAMTMSQKILAAYAGLSEVKAGQLIKAGLDLVLANDITGPVAINEFQKAGFTEVNKDVCITLVMDHFAPNKDINSAEGCKKCRTFARHNGIEHFYDVGEMGVEHALIPEKGLIAPGELAIGADSHTCTYGALGAFSTGVGSTDMATAMASGKAWFKVPSAIKVLLRNKKQKWVSGKDIILHLIGLLGVDGAIYQSLEFSGDGLSDLSMADRLTISNMAIECGAKNGIFAVDDITRKYMDGRCNRDWTAYEADPDAEYTRVIELDLSQIPCTVAWPHLPSNTRPAWEGGNVDIDQVVIGSCTNGNIEDMAAAAEILEGKRIKKGLRGIVIPATPKIYSECIERGYVKIFMDAGCIVSTPTCGPCLGGHMGILAAGERCVSTSNRNFLGRMGHTESEVYLASPAVAAASAVMGRISHPEEVSGK